MNWPPMCLKIRLELVFKSNLKVIWFNHSAQFQYCDCCSGNTGKKRHFLGTSKKPIITLYILLKERIVNLVMKTITLKLLLKRLTKKKIMCSSALLCSHYIWNTTSICTYNYFACLVSICLCSYYTHEKVLKILKGN